MTIKTKNRPTAAVILAGGKGTRMKSSLPKVLLPLAGKPLLQWVVESCQDAGSDPIVVITGPKNEAFFEVLGNRVHFAVQETPRGTGHALMAAQKKLLGFAGNLLVLVGDAPFVSAELLHQLLAHHEKNRCPATILTAVFENPPPYGRVIRDGQGRVVKIVEECHCSSDQKRIKEVLTSQYCFDWPHIQPYLGQIPLDAVKKEYFLTDLVGILTAAKQPVAGFQAPNNQETLGLNTPQELARAELIFKNTRQ